MIDWTAFTWEAFATLITGLAAVGAAFAVATRQGRITERQIALQELSFRSEVFERRAVVYNIIRSYVAHALVTPVGFAPQSERYEDYQQAMDTIRFLFSKRLHLEMIALDAFVVEFFSKSAAIGGAPDKTSAFYHEMENDLRRRRKVLRERLDALPVLFEREMKLTADSSYLEYVTDADEDDVAADIMGSRYDLTGKVEDKNA